MFAASFPAKSDGAVERELADKFDDLEGEFVFVLFVGGVQVFLIYYTHLFKYKRWNGLSENDCLCSGELSLYKNKKGYENTFFLTFVMNLSIKSTFLYEFIFHIKVI